MATLKDVLEHLVRHAEGYYTPALRQEHLDALHVLDDPQVPEAAPDAGPQVPEAAPDAGEA
jgi:hypothetical protein